MIALGANLPSPCGGPRATLEAALAALGWAGLRVVRRSGWFATPAFPAGAGPDYVNGAAAVAGRLEPAEVLARLHAVEAALGRERGRRWAARACDLDLLASGGQVLPDAGTVRAWMARRGRAAMEVPDGLILPHPRLQERGFVLAPLVEVAADWRHPLTGLSVREMLAALPAEALADVRRLQG